MDPEAHKEAQIGAIGGFGAGGLTSAAGQAIGGALGKVGAQEKLNEYIKRNQEQNDQAGSETQGIDVDAFNQAVAEDNIAQTAEPVFTGMNDVQQEQQPTRGKFDSMVDTLLGDKIAQPKEDGTYDYDDVVKEAMHTYGNIWMTLHEDADNKISTEGGKKETEPERVQLGSLYATAERFKNVIDKLDTVPLDTDEKAETYNRLRDDYNAMREAINDIIERRNAKINDQFTIEELDQMTPDEAVKAYGAQDDIPDIPDSDVIPEVDLASIETGSEDTTTVEETDAQLSREIENDTKMRISSNIEGGIKVYSSECIKLVKDSIKERFKDITSLGSDK